MGNKKSRPVQNPMHLADAALSIPLTQSPEFQSLTVDCWEKIFEYLSLREMLAMSRTCKRMRQIAGYYIRENFPGLWCWWIKNRGVCTAIPNNVPINSLSRFITSLGISENLKHSLKMESFASLNTLTLCGIELRPAQMRYIDDILKYVENIDLRGCTIYRDFYEQFQIHCTQLKSLKLEGVKFQPSSAGGSLFSRKYPKLEHFDYISMDLCPTDSSLKRFLDQNSNLKHFGMDADYIFSLQNALIESNNRLDCLFIYTRSWPTDPVIVQQFEQLLNTLYERGFYKKLQLTLTHQLRTAHVFEDGSDERAGVRAYELLSMYEDVNLNRLTHLTELRLWFCQLAANMEILAKSLNKLEQLLISHAETDEILPFFRHSKRLNTVVVKRFRGGALLSDDYTLNLFALNQEREQLEKARKVSIHLSEQYYLPTKWATKHLNLRLVEVTRIWAHEVGRMS